MSLHSLDELIIGLGIEPDVEDLELLLAEFQRDFVDNPFKVNDLNVKVVTKNSNVDGYEGYPETFVHLITRKSGSGYRVFDRNRANRLHWIRRILEFRDEEDILFFQHLEGNGSIRDYYWYESEDFLVIMEEVTPDYLIITSFYIDDDRNRRYYSGKYQAYLKNGV